MKSFYYLLAILFMFVFSACSTIVNGTTQKMQFKSNPDNASLDIFNSEGEKIGTYTTPAKVILDKSKGYFKSELYKVKVHKEGYESMEFSIDRRVSGWYIAGNLVFGVIGWLVVDPLSGGMWVLEASGESVQSKKDTITITLLESLKPSELSKLKKIN